MISHRITYKHPSWRCYCTGALIHNYDVNDMHFISFYWDPTLHAIICTLALVLYNMRQGTAPQRTHSCFTSLWNRKALEPLFHLFSSSHPSVYHNASPSFTAWMTYLVFHKCCVYVYMLLPWFTYWAILASCPNNLGSESIFLRNIYYKGLKSDCTSIYNETADIWGLKYTLSILYKDVGSIWVASKICDKI